MKPPIVVTAPTAPPHLHKGAPPTAAESAGTWTFNVPEYGTWAVNASKGTDSAAGSVTVDTVKQYSLSLAYVKIYGVLWDGTSTTALSRTDDAELFADPVPAVSNGNGSSPFDACYPWSGMVKESRTGGVMVKIPKFWFKWTKSGSTPEAQMRDKAVSGFSVSPAHMDRGRRRGRARLCIRRRYHCKSATNFPAPASPQASITRSAANVHSRQGREHLADGLCHAPDDPNAVLVNMRLEQPGEDRLRLRQQQRCGRYGLHRRHDYHTGTTQSARTTYGLGTQYRWIEGLWDNVYDWMDGCY
jgi:hypothetical protein